MLFAFMLIPSLFWLIRFWSRLPGSYSRAFARVLDFSTPLFNRANAHGPRGQTVVLGRRHAGSIYDRVHRSILRKVDSIKEGDWGRGMNYPRLLGAGLIYADEVLWQLVAERLHVPIVKRPPRRLTRGQHLRIDRCVRGYGRTGR